MRANEGANQAKQEARQNDEQSTATRGEDDRGLDREGAVVAGRQPCDGKRRRRGGGVAGRGRERMGHRGDADAWFVL